MTLLDLAYNNITHLGPDIGKLKLLMFLWLNNNPLKEIPVEIKNCTQLKELDIRETEVSILPRDIAELKGLVSLKLDGCPLNTTFQNSIKDAETPADQMLNISLTLKRKYDRRDYKAKLCNKLMEWKYPSTDKALIEKKVEELFASLKDVNSAGLKRLVRQYLRLFPKDFNDIKIESIKEDLNQLQNDESDREEISRIILRLRANFPKEQLDNVVRLAKDLYRNTNEDGITEMLKYRAYVFVGAFGELSYKTLLENLKKYKKEKVEQKEKAVRMLNKKLNKIYKDDKIEEAITNNMLVQLVNILKKVSAIEDFALKAKKYLPKAVEIATFNAPEIFAQYSNDNK